jgi:hypothetical protein
MHTTVCYCADRAFTGSQAGKWACAQGRQWPNTSPLAAHRDHGPFDAAFGIAMRAAALGYPCHGASAARTLECALPRP